MSYDEQLADRIETALTGRGGLTSRKMFGGMAFMIGGNMACGVIGEEMIVRVAAEDYEKALAEPEVRAFDFTGKPMRGFVCVADAAAKSEKQLAEWVDVGADYAASLPVKEKKKG